jgi:hypothetical protein
MSQKQPISPAFAALWLENITNQSLNTPLVDYTPTIITETIAPTTDTPTIIIETIAPTTDTPTFITETTNTNIITDATNIITETPTAIIDTTTPTGYFSLIYSPTPSQSATPTIDPFQILFPQIIPTETTVDPYIATSSSVPTIVIQSATESSSQTDISAGVSIKPRTATSFPSLETTLIDSNTKNLAPKINIGLIIGLTFLGVFLIVGKPLYLNYSNGCLFAL